MNIKLASRINFSNWTVTSICLNILILLLSLTIRDSIIWEHINNSKCWVYFRRYSNCFWFISTQNKAHTQILVNCMILCPCVCNLTLHFNTLLWSHNKTSQIFLFLLLTFHLEGVTILPSLQWIKLEWVTQRSGDGWIWIINGVYSYLFIPQSSRNRTYSSYVESRNY